MKRRANLALAAALAAIAMPGAGPGLAIIPAARAAGPTVSGGSATITSSGNTTTINQTTTRGVYTWSSLNLPAGGILQFIEPSSSSIALNRVTSGVAIINGSILSNGQVWIVDPAGVFFGRGSSVNVAGLIATTSDIVGGDQNFLNGGSVTFGTPTANPSAAVVNNGTISIAPGGAAVLAGARVVNNGMIEADLGNVVLAGADTFTVDFTGDKLISFAIDTGVSQTPLDRNGSPAAALVANAGTIAAEGGQVLLTARAARSVLTNVINTTGMIEATSAHEENGTIVLDAGAGALDISGTLDVSGKLAGETGGTVTATGSTVTVNSGALIDASGDEGGGSIALGGNFHGAGPLPDATTTTIAAGAVINASAITAGNGGAVAVWSNGTTTFDGTIVAKGGAQGGNGGSVETSGEGVLIVGSAAAVLTSAASGTAGTWLLDPFSNLTITTVSSNSSCPVGNPLVCNSTGDSSEVNVTTIENALNAGTSVTVETTNPGSQNGIITVASPITVSSSTGPVPTLTISANGNINVNQAITGSTSSPLNVDLTTPSGTITVAANVTTGGGTFSASGSSPLQTFVENSGVTISTAGSTAGTVNISMAVASGEITLSGTTNAGGAVTLTAGSNGVILGGPLTAASGAINIISAGNISTNVGAPITSDGGFIDLSANSSSGGTPTGSGSIAVNATIATDGNGATGGAISIGTSGGTGTLSLAGDLLTQGGAITISVPTFVSASISVDSTDNFAYPIGAPVTFDSTVDDLQLSPSNTLQVTSGDDTITFNGAVGGSRPLAYLRLSGGGNGGTVTTGIDIEAPMTLAGGGGFFLVNQNIVINAPITEPSGSGTLIILAGDSDAAGQIPPTSTLVFGISGEINFAGSSGSIDLSYRPASFPNNDPTVLSHVIMGTGTFTPTLNVESVSDLEAINSNLSGNFDLDISGSTLDLSSVANFAPFMIGSSSTPFTGSFNGGNNTIANLTISSSATDVGLFGNIGSGGIVENLSLANVNVSSSASSGNVGALAGTNNGTITSSSVYGLVSGSGSVVGGLVGSNNGTITQSFAAGQFSGGGFGVTFEVGGLVGGNQGTISQSYSAGAVLNSDLTGGLAAFNSGTITDSFSTAAVIGGNTSTDGGLVGNLVGSGTIGTSYSTGLVSAAGVFAAGGLVGTLSSGATTSQVTNSYWDTSTSGQSTSAAGTGMATASLQGALPAGFNDGNWDVLTSPVASYPYPTGIFTSAPQVVTGTAYSAINVDPIAGEIIAGQVNGTSFGETLTGADGYYYFLLPNGTIPAANGQVIVSSVSGGVNYTQANAFADNADGSVSGVDFGGTSLRLISSGATASGILDDLATAVGSGGTGIGFIFGANNVPSLPAGQSTLTFRTSAPLLTLDVPINLGTSQLAINDLVGGTVQQTQPFTAANLTLFGSGATFTLTNSGNSFASFAASTGSASIADASNLEITTLGPPASQTIGATLTGTLTISDPGTVTQNQPIVAGGLALLGTGGTYTLTNGANSIGNLAANTGTITLDATGTLTIDPVASTTVFTTIDDTTLSATSIALGASAAVTAPSNGTLNLTAASGGSISQSQGATISVPGSNAFVVLTANTITLSPLAGGSASITGSGGIDLEGVTDATTIGVGTSAAGTLNINQTTLNAIGTPLSIGAEGNAQTGLITVAGPVTFSSPTGIGQLSQTGQINLSGTITSAATAPGVADGAPPPYTGIDYFLAFLAPTVLQANTTINTAAAVSSPGAVVFASTIDGAASFVDGLTVNNAGGGDIIFAGRVGFDSNVVATAVTPGAVSLTTTGNVNMTMAPLTNNTDGFDVTSLTINAATLSATSFISTHGDSAGSAHPSGGNILIDTTGNVSIAGTLTSGGGLNTATPANDGSAGTITIDATGGSVAIGTSLTTSSASVLANGYAAGTNDTSLLGQGAGSGAAVSITGTSITIGTSIVSNGGSALVTGAVGTGGNAGSVTLTATNGSVTLGESVSGGSTPAAIAAVGGTTGASANGGSANTVTITATNGISAVGGIVALGGEAGGSGISGNGAEVSLSGGSGAVIIGTGLTLITQYGGATSFGGDDLKGEVASILTRGGETYTSSSTPGNGGQIVISGASINLPFGVSSGGGDAADLFSSPNGPVIWAPNAVSGWTGTGSTANGGNAGSIMLTTGGAVTIGTPAGSSSTSTGDTVGLYARGGNSSAGNGGAGAAVSVTASTISLARVLSNGGDSLSATATGGTGANISLTATSASAGAITLYGNQDDPTSATASLQETLIARGGFIDLPFFEDAAPPAVMNGTGGTITLSVPAGGTTVLATSTANTSNAETTPTAINSMSSANTITVASTVGLVDGEWIGGTDIPAGDSIVSITGTTIVMSLPAIGNPTGGSLFGFEVPNGDYNGSTVGFSASGGLAHGGTIGITGPIEGAASNTQSLRIFAGDGSFSTSGAIGDLTSLADITIGAVNTNIPTGGTGGAFTFGGAVTVGTEFSDLNSGGSLTFNGLLTTPNLTATSGASVAVNDGAVFSGTFAVSSSSAQPITLGGDIIFDTNLGGSASGNFVLSSATTIDFSGASGAIALGGTIDATTAGADAFTFNAPTGGATLSTVLGGTTALGGVTLDGSALTFSGTIKTAGGAVAINGPSVLAGTTTIDTTNGGVTTAGAAVTFASTLDGSIAYSDNLTIDAGTSGTITADATIGGTKRLGQLTIGSSNAADFSGAVNVAGLSIGGTASLTAASNITTNGANSTILPTAGGAIGIVTSGAVTIDGGIIATGGVDSNTGANGGTVTINAGGAVSIGSAITLTTSGSGSTLATTSTPSVVTVGFSPTTATQSAGNGGTISITGSSLTLAQTVVSNGGSALVAGSTANGGNAGSITLTATAGNVTVGSAATGDLIDVISAGGNSLGGAPGAGGNISISGTTISLSKVVANAGGSELTSAATASAAGNITLIATASSGDAVVLFGSSIGAALSSSNTGTLDAIGGEYDDTALATAGALPNGVLTGAGGNITIEGSALGAPLNGTADIRLVNNSTASALNGGATVSIVAGGGLGTGGTILINGPVVGTTANVENLRVAAANGAATVAGSIGSASIPLGTLVIGPATNLAETFPSGSNYGAFTIAGAVNVATLDITATSGSATFNGFVTAGGFTSATGNVFFNDGDSFSGAFTLSAPLVLTSDETIDTSSTNSPITIDATIDDSTPGADTVTFNAGTGIVTINDPIGGTTAVGAVTITGGTIDLGSNIITKSGAVTFNGPTILTQNVAINTAANSSAGANVTFNGTLDAAEFGVQTLTIAAGTAGDIDFTARIGYEATSTPTLGCTCSAPGALTITSANAVDMSMPFGNFDGVSVGSLSISGVATVTDNSFITTSGVEGNNGGAVSITATGAVAIGAGIPFMVSGTNVTSPSSINTSGFDTTIASQAAGTGGNVNITAASINLPFGIEAGGGDGAVSGTPVNGGNGGTITLTATGAIDAGSLLAGPQANLEASGGGSFAGNGGNGGTITVSGQNLFVAGADTSGGSTRAGAPQTGGNAGSITLIATANSGAAVVLYGTNDTATGISSGGSTSLLAVGGLINDTNLDTGCGCTPNGTVNGAGGNVTIEGSAGGAALAGSSFIQLQNSTSSAFGGPTVLVIAAGGSPGTGGAVTFKGPVQATTSGVENLHFEASNGSVTITGPVGSATALDTLAFGFAPGVIPTVNNSGAITFDGAVTAGTAITDLRTAGSLAFDGLVTTPSFTMTGGATSLAMTGGASFAGPVIVSGGATTLDGTFTFSGSATGFSDAGAITLTGATTIDTSAVNGAVSLGAVTGASADAFTVDGGGGAVTFTGALSGLGAVALSGGTLTLDGISASGNVTGTGSGAITSEHAIATSGTVALTAAGNLTLDAGATVTGSGSGNAVVLATGGVFDNLAGSGGIVANGGGRWLVWSQNPANDTVGSLPFGFKQYAATFGVTTPAQSIGDGLLYTLAPSVTAVLTGSVSKTYDATTSATLASANYAVAGAESGDTVTFNDPTSGTYASANAGAGITVTVSGVSLASVTSGGLPVYGYTLASANAAGAVGTINPLAVVLTGAKTYDATTNAAASSLTISNDLNGANLTLSGTGTLASANAGSETFAAAGSLVLGGSAAGNYTLANVTTNGSAESVGQLAVLLTGAKTYDATTNAAASGLTISNDLNGANLTLSGTGTLASANAGSEAFAAAGTLALGGSAAGNYTLVGITSNGSTETVGQLAVVLTGAKTYDATTNAAASGLTITNDLDGGNLTLSGTGTLASANAGSESFAAAGSLVLGGSAAGNYTLANVTTNGSAESVGQLAVVLTGAKTYDATTNAAASGLAISNDLNGANLTLSGTGTLASANAGSEAFAAAGTLALGGSAAGNYTLANVTTNGSAESVGQLAVVLTGARTYDATTNAAASGLTISNDLNGANLTLSGTGTLTSANAGSEAFAAAGSLALGGSAAGNYSLANVTTNGSAESVGQLAVVLTGAKTYDATTNAAASGLTISNDLNGANLTLSGTGTLASANAGSEAFAAAGTLALGGSAAGNYTLVGITSNGSAESVGQLAVVLTGAKTYDATTNAAASGLTISNDLNGANLTLSGTGTLASANAGSEAFASAGSLALGGSAAGNYTLVGITSNGSAESVGQLAVVLTGAKTYDATTNAAAGILTVTNNLDGGNLTLSGTATLASANAGSEAFAAAGTLALGGSAAGNYTLANVTTNGSAESVGQLAVVLTGAKTYDATTNAAASGLAISNDLNGGNLTLSGTGTLASANAGSEAFAAAGTLALGGSAAGNYTLVGITSNGSAESVGQLAVVLTGAKTYDATTNAAASGLTISNDLNGANLTLSGTGTLASANAGSEAFASAGSLALGGSAAGNYTLANVTTNGSAESVGQLAVVLTGAKTYDATTNAAAASLTISNDLSGANLTLSGTGTLASANAGSETFAAAGSLALGGSAAGNYTLVGITSNGSAESVGQLAVVLTGAKTYDATTNAAASGLTISNDLNGGNLTLSGMGTLTSANAGSESFISAGSLALGGSAAGNYSLANVTTNGSAESVGQLAVVLTGAKTYDATTNAAAGILTVTNNLDGGNLTLSGTGTLASANAGSEAFAASGSLALGGSAAGNYTLSAITTNGSAVAIGAGQIVSGDVFSGHGVSPLTGASVSLILGGTSEGTVTSGAGGAYQFDLPLGTISPSGTGLFVYLTGGAVNGNSFYNAATGSIANLDIYGNYFRVLNAPASLTQTGSALAATLGSITSANFLFTLGAGNALNLAGSNFELAAPTPAAFTIDETVNAASFAVTASEISLAANVTTTAAQTYTGPANVPLPGATLTGSNITFTSTIDGPGALTLDGPGTVTLGGALGGGTPMGAVSITASNIMLAAGIWTLSGIVTLDGTVTLTQNAMIDTDGTGADIDLMGPVNGGAFTLTLDSGTGNVALSGVTAAGLVFTPSAPPLVTLDSGSYDIGSGTYTFGTVALNGDLSFGQATDFGPATVISPSTITSPGVPIDFTSTLTGASASLAIEPSTGAVTFADLPVGVAISYVQPPASSNTPPAGDLSEIEQNSTPSSGSGTSNSGTSDTGTGSSTDTSSTGAPGAISFTGTTSDVVSSETASLLNALAPTSGGITTSSGAGPLEVLTDSSTSTGTGASGTSGSGTSAVVVTANAFTVTTSSGGSQGDTGGAAGTSTGTSQATQPGSETDGTTNSIATSLGGAPASGQGGKPVALVNGVLSETPTAPGTACSASSSSSVCKPHSVPPADQEYSSWGNEAYWQ